MASTSDERLDGTGRGLPESPSEEPRAAVIDLVARLAAPDRSSAAEPADSGTRILMTLRFPTTPCPSATGLAGLGGVRRVHTLCGWWDYMLECTEEVSATFALGAGCHQSVTVLGSQAEIEILRVSEDLSCPTPGADPPQYAPPA
jgi:hypothetical protein